MNVINKKEKLLVLQPKSFFIYVIITQVDKSLLPVEQIEHAHYNKY